MAAIPSSSFLRGRSCTLVIHRKLGCRWKITTRCAIICNCKGHIPWHRHRHRHRHPRNDPSEYPREDVGVGVVECGLNQANCRLHGGWKSLLTTVNSCKRRPVFSDFNNTHARSRLASLAQIALAGFVVNLKRPLTFTVGAVVHPDSRPHLRRAGSSVSADTCLDSQWINCYWRFCYKAAPASSYRLPTPVCSSSVLISACRL